MTECVGILGRKRLVGIYKRRKKDVKCWAPMRLVYVDPEVLQVIFSKIDATKF